MFRACMNRPACRFAGPGSAARSRAGGGFTLIELLVVIAIISLLVSMIMPSLRSARELARTAACASNARSIILAQVLYAEEEEGRITPTSDMTLGEKGRGIFDVWEAESPRLDREWWGGVNVNCWADFLVWAGMVGGGSFDCPSDRHDYTEQWDRQEHLSYGILRYQLYSQYLDHGYTPGSAYGGQEIDDTGAVFAAGSGSATGCYGPSVERDIARPSEKVMFADTRGGSNSVMMIWSQGTSWLARGLYAHMGYSGTYGFFDGHAATLTWEEVFGVRFDPDCPDGYQGGLAAWNLDLAEEDNNKRCPSYPNPGKYPMFVPWQ